MRQWQGEYQAVIEHVDVGIILVDLLDRVRIINPCAVKLLGIRESLEPEEVTLRELGSVSKIDIEQVIRRARLKQPAAFREQIVSSRPSFVYDVVIKTIHHADGVRIGNLCLIRDISKQWTEARERSEFLSMVTHELFNPLTPVKEGLALLMEEKIGEINPTQRQCLSVVYEETSRLSRLVSDLLEINRLDAGQARLHRTIIDVHHLVRSVMASVEKKAYEKKIVICENIPFAIENLYADEDRMKQVLFNLLDNAIKYSPPSSPIEISGGSRSGGIEISVKDNGFGMLKSDIKKLFKRFSQLDHEEHVRNRDKGSGLGLSIVQEIVRLHHGRIKVRSEYGRGSTFTILLPKRRKVRQHVGS
jgi:two-component system sensor histidine kinase VicK